MNRGVRFLATAAGSFVIYLLLADSLQPEELAAGGAVAIIAALLMVRYSPLSGKIFHPARIIKALVYFPYFLWKMVVANLQIASIVLRPALPIHPTIVRESSTLKTPEGLLLLTSSITLTPGTLSVDEKDGYVYVHQVSKADPDTKILKPFEKWLKGVTE